jgi:hypothetical protein
MLIPRPFDTPSTSRAPSQDQDFSAALLNVGAPDQAPPDEQGRAVARTAKTGSASAAAAQFDTVLGGLNGADARRAIAGFAGALSHEDLRALAADPAGRTIIDRAIDVMRSGRSSAPETIVLARLKTARIAADLQEDEDFRQLDASVRQMALGLIAHHQTNVDAAFGTAELAGGPKFSMVHPPTQRALLAVQDSHPGFSNALAAMAGASHNLSSREQIEVVNAFRSFIDSNPNVLDQTRLGDQTVRRLSTRLGRIVGLPEFIAMSGGERRIVLDAVAKNVADLDAVAGIIAAVTSPGFRGVRTELLAALGRNPTDRVFLTGLAHLADEAGFNSLPEAEKNQIAHILTVLVSHDLYRNANDTERRLFFEALCANPSLATLRSLGQRKGLTAAERGLQEQLLATLDRRLAGERTFYQPLDDASRTANRAIKRMIMSDDFTGLEPGERIAALRTLNDLVSSVTVTSERALLALEEKDIPPREIYNSIVVRDIDVYRTVGVTASLMESSMGSGKALIAALGRHKTDELVIKALTKLAADRGPDGLRPAELIDAIRNLDQFASSEIYRNAGAEDRRLFLEVLRVDPSITLASLDGRTGLTAAEIRLQADIRAVVKTTDAKALFDRFIKDATFKRLEPDARIAALRQFPERALAHILHTAKLNDPRTGAALEKLSESGNFGQLEPLSRIAVLDALSRETGPPSDAVIQNLISLAGRPWFQSDSLDGQRYSVRLIARVTNYVQSGKGDAATINNTLRYVLNGPTMVRWKEDDREDAGTFSRHTGTIDFNPEILNSDFATIETFVHEVNHALKPYGDGAEASFDYFMDEYRAAWVGRKAFRGRQPTQRECYDRAVHLVTSTTGAYGLIGDAFRNEGSVESRKIVQFIARLIGDPYPERATIASVLHRRDTLSSTLAGLAPVAASPDDPNNLDNHS